MALTPQERCSAAMTQAMRCRCVASTVAEASTEASIQARSCRQESESTATTSSKSPASASPSSSILRNPANRLWIKVTQRESFIQHLRNWACDHDSSVHFHGSISLFSQDAVSEVLELGSSVNCLLFDTSSGGPPRKIVIRLFQSRHYRNDAQKSRKEHPARALKDLSNSSTARPGEEKNATRMLGQMHPSVAPYQLVVRSGSGWVTARQYFDKYHFTNRAKMAKEMAFATSLGAHQYEPATETLMHQSNAVPNLINSLGANVDIAQVPGWVGMGHNNVAAHANSVSSNTGSGNYNNMTAVTSAVLARRCKGATRLALSRSTEDSVSGHSLVEISPLFRPFLRLPQELQDEIFYHAIQYTGNITITRVLPSKDVSSLSNPPITISKLFRISKMTNEHMVAHLFRRTNFHFGMTGFTNFLWQIGPLHRSNLQNLTFHFGKASLLHCIRWLAPDPLWELFEPPVATNPPALTYFWRCQLQDLMKELCLRTLTVDIRDVPLTDVPMVIRILRTAIGSPEHIRVIDNCGSATAEECCHALQKRCPDMREPTWRELSFEYHGRYKYQRWHMKHKWTLHGVDFRAPMNEWMDQNRVFFDA